MKDKYYKGNFVKTFRTALKPHINKHYQKIFETLDISPVMDVDTFIKVCSAKNKIKKNRLFDTIRLNCDRGCNFPDYINLNFKRIGGADIQFKIVDVPSAICKAYKQASRAA